MRLTLTKKENKWTQETVYFTLKLYFSNRNMEYKTQLLQTQHVKVMWPTFKLKCLLLNPDVNLVFIVKHLFPFMLHLHEPRQNDKSLADLLKWKQFWFYYQCHFLIRFLIEFYFIFFIKSSKEERNTAWLQISFYRCLQRRSIVNILRHTHLEVLILKSIN